MSVILTPPVTLLELHLVTNEPVAKTVWRASNLQHMSGKAGDGVVGMQIHPHTGARWQVGFSYAYNNWQRSLMALSNTVGGNGPAGTPAQLVARESVRSRIAVLTGEIEASYQQEAKYEYAQAVAGGLRERITALRELAVQAANNAELDANSRAAIQQEAQAIRDMYNSTVREASYNGAGLFTGGEGSVGSLSVFSQIDLTTETGIDAMVAQLDSLSSELDTTQSEIASVITHDISAARSSKEIERENLLAAESLLSGSDFVAQLIDSMVAERQVQLSARLLKRQSEMDRTILNLIG